VIEVSHEGYIAVEVNGHPVKIGLGIANQGIVLINLIRSFKSVGNFVKTFINVLQKSGIK
jgi:hypothetical protein